jgi:hypothetical protein
MAFNLASIQTGPSMAPPRIIIYGSHGLGKTTLCSETPSPILLPTEDGKGSLSMPSFPLATSWADVCEAIGTLLTEPHNFSSLTVDSLDWLERMIWAETCARHNWKDVEQPGFGKGFLAAIDVWMEFFSGLNALRDQRGMMVLLTAHCQVKRFDDPATGSYDRYGIKLQDRASAVAQEWADAVLFLNQRTMTSKTDVGFNKEITRGVGMGERYLYTEERPAYLAKNRYGLPHEVKAPKGQAWAALSKHLFPSA